MKKIPFLLTLFLSVAAQAQMEMPVAQPKFILATAPKIQEHLKLTDDQKKKIKGVLEGILQDDGNGRQMIMLTGDTDMEQLDKDVVAAFNPVQMKRFSELYVQRNGYTALSLKEYAEKLSISDEQKKKLDVAWDNHRERMQKFFTENAPGSRELHLEKADIAKLRDATAKEVEAVLTADQIAKWKELQGEKFDFGDDRF